MSNASTFVSLDESVSIDAWQEDNTYFLTLFDRDVELTITLPLVEGVHELPSGWVTTGGVAKLRALAGELLEFASRIEDSL